MKTDVMTHDACEDCGGTGHHVRCDRWAGIECAGCCPGGCEPGDLELPLNEEGDQDGDDQDE